MRLLTNESEKLTPEKRQELLQLLAKLDGTDDQQLILDNAILRYAESRLGYARLNKKNSGASKRNKKNAAAEATTTAEVKA